VTIKTRGEHKGRGLAGTKPPSGEFSPSPPPNTTDLAPPNFRVMNINVSIKQAKDLWFSA